MLHDKMIKFASPKITFSDLFEFGNDLINDSGYENLDFLSNLGHCIETDLKDRKFIDKSCMEKLGILPSSPTSENEGARGASSMKIFIILTPTEDIYLRAYDSTSAVRTGLNRYFNFHNSRRPHSSLDRLRIRFTLTR